MGATDVADDLIVVDYGLGNALLQGTTVKILLKVLDFG
jgi:hypothetical protein